jgi:hypothetical protein
MGEWLRIAVWSFTSALRSQRDLALENVALRQQLMVIQRQPGSLRLMDRDRLFGVWLRRLWPGCLFSFVGRAPGHSGRATCVSLRGDRWAHASPQWTFRYPKRSYACSNGSDRVD